MDMKAALLRFGWLRYLPLFGVLSMVLGCPAAKDETKKGKEVPAEDAQAAKEKEIKELFKDKDPEDLPRIFLNKGKETKDDQEGRFMLLKMARDYGAKSGSGDDIDRAFEAVDELAKSFDIDALEWKRDTVAMLIESLKTPILNYDLTGICLTLVDGEGEKPLPQNCVAADRYDIANALLGFAETARKRVQPVEKKIDSDDIKMLETKVAAYKKKIQEMEKEFEAAKEARDTLATKPDDKTANLTWGKYLCMIKGDWEKGLPLLEKSEDKELAPPAKKELAKPSSGDEQVKMGDEWWALAENESGITRKELKKHAVNWYKRAENSVSGLTLTRIKKNIKEVEPKE
jgi:hypothetical protein